MHSGSSRAEFTAEQRRERHIASAQAHVAEELAAGLLKGEFVKWIHARRYAARRGGVAGLK